MSPTLRVRHLLLAIPVLATMCLFVVFWVAEARNSLNQSRLETLRATLIPVSEASRELESILGLIQRELQDAVAGEDSQLALDTERLRIGFLQVLEQTAALDPPMPDDLDQIDRSFRRYYELALEATLRMIIERRTDSAQVQALEEMTRTYNRLTELLAAYRNGVRDSVREAFEETARNNRATRTLNGLVISVSAVFLCGVSFFLARSLTRPLGELMRVVSGFSEGKEGLRAPGGGAGELSELASAFNEMMDRITRGRTEEEAHGWVMTGLSDLSDALRPQTDLESLADAIIESLASHTGALVGALYLPDEQGVFALAGHFGYPGGEVRSREFRSGEGLVGQVIKSAAPMRVDEVPGDYLCIASGSGSSSPHSLLISPIVSGDSVAGVIELAAFHRFTELQAEFVELSGERITAALDALRYRLQLQTALHRSQRQAERLKQSQEDLNEANRMLEEHSGHLESSNRELEAFAYVASHDLQEPLRKIEAYGQRLEDKCGEALSETGRAYLERMSGAAGRMRNLINDLLSFSRVTTQAQPFCDVDLDEVIRQVLGDLEVRLEQTNASVEVMELGVIEADPRQMQQLFQNLISNALKFRRPEVAPRILISGRRLESTTTGSSRFEIAVEDNGIGIEPKYYDRIFQVFQRLHGRSAYPGTGIGLALCKKITDRHDGAIRVESAVGQGSRFVVSLPCLAATGGVANESAA